VQELQNELRAKERAFEDSQSQLAASKEELDAALESLRAPVRITSQEEGEKMIWYGLHAVKTLEVIKQQF